MSVGLLVVGIGFLPGLGHAQTAYTELTVEDGGRVVGSVTLGGEVPVPGELAVSVDLDVCGVAPKLDESLLVGPHRGVANAVVWIREIGAGKGWGPEVEPELDQVGCQFVPHVVIVPAGASLAVVNSDGILHNFSTRSTVNRPINKAQPGRLKRLPVSFRRPEMVEVECDVHDWMSAWVVVAAHPYYAVTGEDGSFVLEDVPPGTYTLEFWHEKLGTRSGSVTVTPGGESRIAIEYRSG